MNLLVRAARWCCARAWCCKVDTAYQVARAIYDKESPRRPEAEVKRLIIEALRPVRFYEGRGYYFIDDMAGQFILLPTAPQLEGKTLLDNKDDTGHFIMRGLIEAAGKPDGEASRGIDGTCRTIQKDVGQVCLCAPLCAV
ncbi:MAG: cache domain-containing protein [Dechloromonas sp.]|uniref:Cache domain-containing protein n=1 Tax=Candidatus Dechloromonas phosphorivorans TaxID=2899244 RepID=A0A935MWU4_9RHOO|nr:cache domain-containing protein [Candidatus Dechloromonas phosphorivorans]